MRGSKITNYFVVLFLILSGGSALAGNLLKFSKGTLTWQDVLESQNMTEEYSQSREEQQDFILQFKNTITNKNRAQLEQAKIQIFRYIPDDAYVVRAFPWQMENFMNQNASSVRAYIPYQGEFKISENLPTISIFSTGSRQNVIISFFTQEDRINAIDQLQQIDQNIEVYQQDGRYLSAWIDSLSIQEVTHIRGVEFVQPNEKIQTLDIDFEVTANENGNYTDLTGFESGTRILNLDKAWRLGFTGRNQIVSMADTGLDKGAAGLSPDFQGSVLKGISFGIGATDWDDPMGHGTHVAGSILGRGTASAGLLRGAAYEAQFVIEGMWSPLLNNLTVPSKIATLFEAAYKEGARIQSNSWGSASNLGSYDSISQNVDDFMWNHPDFLIFFAAGNSGVDLSKDGRIDSGSIGIPATSKNVMTVGASENYVLKGGIQKKARELKNGDKYWSVEPIASSLLSDNPNGVAIFSSRGPTKDGRRKPEILAPGTNILSARSHQEGAQNLWGKYNDDYVWSGGTSMACPLAAGSGVVVRQILMERLLRTNPTAALLKAVMIHTASDMYPGQYGMNSPTQELLTLRPNNDEGFGRVNLESVLELLTSPTTLLVDDTAGIAQGERKEWPLLVPENGQITATLSYTDAPSSPTAAQNIVNVVEISIKQPNGNEFLTHDDLNNSKIIELKNLPAGKYILSAQGIKIPIGKLGKQPFALVANVK